MFKVSDDLDSDDDFLGKEFNDDFLSCSPNHFATNTSVGVKAVGSLPNTPSTTNDITQMPCSRNGVKSSVTIAKEFQPKTKTSPILQNPSETRSSLLRAIPRTPLTPFLPPLDVQPSMSEKEERVVHIGLTNSVEVPHSKFELSSTLVDNVEQRNSAFLAAWNDDNFFDGSKEKQPPPASHNHTPVVSSKACKTVRRRRFPGPAGLLPPRQGNTSLIAPEEFLNELKGEDSDPTFQEIEVLSQSSGSVFEGGAWSAMLEDLGAAGRPLLKSMNLASIKIVGKNLKSYKVPFLSVLVQSIDASHPDTTAVFKDPNGEMHGVIHRDVWDQFCSDIAIGTVLVLRNVGIISAGYSSRNHVINITGNNLTAIYSPKDELNVQLKRIHEFAASTSSTLLAEWERVEAHTNNSASPLPRRVPTLPRSSPHVNGLRAGPHHCGSVVGNGDSLPFINPNSHPIGRTTSRPAVPSINQRNGNTTTNYPPVNPDAGLDPNIRVRSNGAIAPNTCMSSKAASPFSPMLSRHCSRPTNQYPVNTNNENSNSVGNQKFAPKSPFTLKTPAGARPLLPPNASHSSTTGMTNPSTYYQPPPQASTMLPIKKPKLSPNPSSGATSCKNPTASKKNPFQVEADNSEIDSFLEGIDADSLFGDF